MIVLCVRKFSGVKGRKLVRYLFRFILYELGFLFMGL